MKKPSDRQVLWPVNGGPIAFRDAAGQSGQTDVLLMITLHRHMRATLGESGDPVVLPTAGGRIDRSGVRSRRRGGLRTAGIMAGLAAFGLWTAYPALAQEHHAAGHPYYSNWINKKGTGCCNNQDCGEIADADVREDGNATEVRIDGEWCPVQSWMYLKAGNAPNWSVNHVCVVPDSLTLADRRPCARLLCFQPKPGT